MNIDWKLLRKQKLTLVKLTNSTQLFSNKVISDLQGILNLIDALQDETIIKQNKSEKEVFGKLKTN